MMKIVLLLAVLGTPIAGWAQSNERPEILVLGTYHMANPGHDIHNMQADDVLSPKRQQEIAQFKSDTGWPKTLDSARSTRSMRVVISRGNELSTMRRPMVAQRSSRRSMRGLARR
jgi:hypothetical protein